MLGRTGKGLGPSLGSSPAPVPPTFRQAPSRPQDVVLVSAGDKAVLSCETDAFPEPTVAWQNDQKYQGVEVKESLSPVPAKMKKGLEGLCGPKSTPL